MPSTAVDVSADREVKAMDEPGRWVTKAEAAQELEMSLSTLDRKIRKGEIEVLREGRRVYVRMHGPELMSDEELLERTIANLDESERTSSELERERDEARQAASGSRDAYEEVTEAYRKERAEHGRTRQLALRLGLVAAALFVLLIISVVVTWLPLT